MGPRSFSEVASKIPRRHDLYERWEEKTDIRLLPLLSAFLYYKYKGRRISLGLTKP
jgi:hypothetical protein